jgi:hypothetical protein
LGRTEGEGNDGEKALELAKKNKALMVDLKFVDFGRLAAFFHSDRG